MAINYTVSFTFAPNTTIQSSQVNTNFSDNANTWTGLEALTKTFAKLKVDVDPSTALEVSTKQYVDHYAAYRKPVLVYSSGTVVNIEVGINGTSGQAQIQFPDGTLRTDSTTSRINCNLAQNAVLSGTAQSGLRTGSQTANTRYAIYLVKVSDSSTNIVSVADTIFPIQTNFATLNTNFGTNSWVYLGYIFNGNGLGGNNVVVPFVQAGAITYFTNAVAANVLTGCGVLLAGTGGATTLTYTYTTGSSSVQLPNTISHVMYQTAMGATANVYAFTDSGASKTFIRGLGAASTPTVLRFWASASDGLKLDPGASVAQDILIAGFMDGALGVGSNPLL